MECRWLGFVSKKDAQVLADRVFTWKSMVYPSGIASTLTFTFDPLNRVDFIKRDTGSGPFNLVDYDYAGLYLDRRQVSTDYVAAGVAPQTVLVDYEPAYDLHRRTSHIRNKARTASWSGKVLSNHAYTFDSVGNRLDVTPNSTANYFGSGLQKDIDYGYDDLHRLTSATYNTDTQSEAFDYDVLGNRETWTKRSTAVANYTSNEANEYETIESTDLDYDAAGNLISTAAGYGYAYDNDNRLTLIFLDSNADGDQDSGETTLATYQYDAVGRRIEYVDHITGTSATTTRYYHDGDNVAAEYDAATTPVLQRYYVHGTQYIDERVLVHEATAPNPVNRERYYFLRDLYTVDGLVNNRGHELERYTYDAYGNPKIHVVKVFDVTGTGGAYDGTINAADGNAVSSQIGNDPSVVGTILDINGDGSITNADVTLISNNAGQAIATSPTSAINNPYLFTGRTLDILWKPSQGVNLITQDNRNRSYDPIHGRWLQRDRIEYVAGNNLYEYTLSSPSNYLDSNGDIPLDTLLDVEWLIVDLALGAGAATIAMDVAALVVPYVPNPGIVQRATRLIKGVEWDSGLVRSANLRTILDIDTNFIARAEKTYQDIFRTTAKELWEQDERLLELFPDFVRKTSKEISESASATARNTASAHGLVTLEYIGQRPNAVGNVYPRHFRAPRTQEATLHGAPSKWAPDITDENVRSWIELELQNFRPLLGGSQPVTFKDLNGRIVDSNLTWGDGRVLAKGRTVGYSNGKCTTKFKLKVELDGTIHAFPVDP